MYSVHMICSAEATLHQLVHVHGRNLLLQRRPEDGELDAAIHLRLIERRSIGIWAHACKIERRDRLIRGWLPSLVQVSYEIVDFAGIFLLTLGASDLNHTRNICAGAKLLFTSLIGTMTAFDSHILAAQPES